MTELVFHHPMKAFVPVDAVCFSLDAYMELALTRGSAALTSVGILNEELADA